MTITPPPGFSARPPRREEAQELADLLAASETAIRGQSEMTLNDFLGDWEGVDIDRDAIAMVDGSGRIAAYADTHQRGNELYYVYGYVHPAALGRGLGGFLISWGEVRALKQAAGDGSPEIRVRHHINQRDQPGCHLFSTRGYGSIRATLTMTIDL